MNVTTVSVPLSPSAELPKPDAPEPPADFAPPPCFYWNWCSQAAAINKAGRSVCRRCAGMLRGTEYPLRDASRDRLEFIRHRIAIGRSSEL